MRATLTYLLLSTLSASFLVHAAEAEQSFNIAEDNATPTPVVQQVAQVVVIDKNDVLSIAADMAIAAAMAAAAAEDETVSSDSIGPLETSEAQQSTASDVAAGRDVADGIGAGEIIGESVSAASSAIEDEFSENVDSMLQQQAASTSDVKLVVTASEFTFSPITLAPESVQSSVLHSAKATTKPSAHVSPPAAGLQQVKSISSSTTLTTYSIVSLTLSLCLMGHFL